MALVLVTGGTGRAGRPVVQRLHDAGRELRVLSHTRPPAIDGVDYVKADLVTGEGVAVEHFARDLHGDVVLA